jgi:glutathione synthase/RimK-type ligase-like ATP-grasp enzyme
MKKILAIYFSKPGAEDYPLVNKNFRESYVEFIEFLEKNNIDTRIVRNDSYIGEGKFDCFFKYSKNTDSFDKINKIFAPDLILNRDSDNTIPRIESCKVINSYEFDDVCRDKILCYKNFKNYSPKTFLVNNFMEFQDVAKDITTKKVVLKPRFGEGAWGVHVIEIDTVTEDLYSDWSDIIVQDFLDSSKGIKNLVIGKHEVNLYVVNGRIVAVRLKKPPKGQFISSSAGAVIGKTWGVDINELPEDLIYFVSEVLDGMKKFGFCFMRIDCIKDISGKYKLVEINSRPGLMNNAVEGKWYWDFNGSLGREIIKLLS